MEKQTLNELILISNGQITGISNKAIDDLRADPELVLLRPQELGDLFYEMGNIHSDYWNSQIYIGTDGVDRDLILCADLHFNASGLHLDVQDGLCDNIYTSIAIFKITDVYSRVWRFLEKNIEQMAIRVFKDAEKSEYPDVFVEVYFDKDIWDR